MTSKTRRKTKQRPADRVVYEVKTERGTTQVEASSVAELKKALLPLLGLDNYGTQAAAHLAHTEKATVQTKTWSVRRVGVLAFVADIEEPAPKRKAAAPASAPSTATASSSELESAATNPDTNTKNSLKGHGAEQSGLSDQPSIYADQ